MDILGAAVATAVTEGSPPLGALRGEVDGLGLALGTAVAAVFAYGLARGRAKRRGRRGIAFLAGWGLLAVALWSPLHALGHVSFTLHMVQHVVLVAVVPPLLLQAKVGAAVRDALPRSWARRGGRHARGAGPRFRQRALSPVGRVTVVLASIVTLWVVHAPAVYDAGLRSPVLHFAEHAALLATATAVWWSATAGPAARSGASVLSFAATGAAGGALAMLIIVAPGPWSPLHDPAAAGLPLSVMDDQQLGGGIMGLLGGTIWVAAAVGAFIRWLRAVERRQDALDRRRSAGRASAVPDAGPPHQEGDRTAGGTPTGSVAGLLLAGFVILGAACEPTGDPEADALADRGEEALVEYGCIACHAVEGIAGPQGSVGPPLDGFGRRQTIAGQLPHTRDNLARWIQDPQDVDPGNVMPDVGVTDEDAEAMVEYLQRLE